MPFRERLELQGDYLLPMLRASPIDPREPPEQCTGESPDHQYSRHVDRGVRLPPPGANYPPHHGSTALLLRTDRDVISRAMTSALFRCELVLELFPREDNHGFHHCYQNEEVPIIYRIMGVRPSSFEHKSYCVHSKNPLLSSKPLA